MISIRQKTAKIRHSIRIQGWRKINAQNGIQVRYLVEARVIRPICNAVVHPV